jgi:hypothetical protein
MWCTGLEAGRMWYFPQTSVPVAEEDLNLLLGHSKTRSRLHKNIANKPGRDQLTGIDREAVSEAAASQSRTVMRRYPAGVTA